MPVDRLSALASHAGAARTAVTSRRPVALRPYARRLAAGVRKAGAILGYSGAAALSVGVVLALASTAWAVWLDVPYQIALLAGYITLAASTCVCAALVAVRHCAPKAEAVGKRAEPDYAAWKRAAKLRVADASRLWCGIEPGHHATAEVTAWASAILDALERGELAKSECSGALAQYRNGWHTEVPRDALKAWARSKGHSPRFLRD